MKINESQITDIENEIIKYIDEYENITLIKQEGINNNKAYKYNDDYSNHKYENSNIEKQLELYYKDKLSNV